MDADGDKNAFDFPFLVFASIVLFFWLRNFRENSMMMGSGGGMPGGRGGMPGGGMPGGIPGAGRQVGGRSFNGRGRNDPNFTPPPSTTFEDVADLMETHDTVWGPMAHLKPVVQMSETQPYWASGSVPLGTHDPIWPAF